jgi:hypothetical protein
MVTQVAVLLTVEFSLAACVVVRFGSRTDCYEMEQQDCQACGVVMAATGVGSGATSLHGSNIWYGGSVILKVVQHHWARLWAQQQTLGTFAKAIITWCGLCWLCMPVAPAEHLQ